jgi:hypothetical protein
MREAVGGLRGSGDRKRKWPLLIADRGALVSSRFFDAAIDYDRYRLSIISKCFQSIIRTSGGRALRNAIRWMGKLAPMRIVKCEIAVRRGIVFQLGKHSSFGVLRWIEPVPLRRI